MGTPAKARAGVTEAKGERSRQLPTTTEGGE